MNAISGEVPGEVKLNRFVAGHSATNHMTPTGADGKTVNNGLPLGLYPVAETDEILLVEKWRDADALAKHMEEPHFKRLGQIKEGFGIETVIEKFITE